MARMSTSTKTHFYVYIACKWSLSPSNMKTLNILLIGSSSAHVLDNFYKCAPHATTCSKKTLWTFTYDEIQIIYKHQHALPLGEQPCHSMALHSSSWLECSSLLATWHSTSMWSLVCTKWTISIIEYINFYDVFLEAFIKQSMFGWSECTTSWHAQSPILESQFWK